MKRYLPIRIGNGQKIENVRFHKSVYSIDNLNNDPRDRVDEDYRLSIITGRTVFSFDKNWVLATTDNSDIKEFVLKPDNKIQIVEDHFQDRTYPSIKIIIHISNQIGQNDQSLNITHNDDAVLKWTSDKSRYTLSLNGQYQHSPFLEINIIFELSDDFVGEDGDYINGKYKIYKTNIIQNLIVDLGSEATQAAYGREGVLRNHVSFKRALQQVYDYNVNSRILQTEKDANLLQTSNIWYKTGLNWDPSNDLVAPLGSVNKELNDNGSLARFAVELGHNNDPDTGFTGWSGTSNINKIPNLKLLSIDGTSFNDWYINVPNSDGTPRPVALTEENRIYLISYIYEHIIKLSLSQIEQLSPWPFCLKLQVLIPNIYGQNKVLDVLQRLNELFNKNENDIRVETFAISEGDASYLGIKNSYLDFDTKEISDDKILIIDAGRGTIDYSILRTTEGDDYYCVRRGGIVGAGQAVTFALMQCFGYKVIKTDAGAHKYGVRAFFKLIEELDGEHQTPMQDFFEEIKFNFYKFLQLEEDGKIPYTEFFNIMQNNNDLDSRYRGFQNLFNQIINNFDSVSELKDPVILNNNLTYQFVNNACDKIADTFFENAGLDSHIKRIKKVYPMGRAFAFKPLLRAFINKIDSLRRINDVWYRLLYKPTSADIKKGIFNFIKSPYSQITIPKESNIGRMKKASIELPKPGDIFINGNTGLLYLIKKEPKDEVGSLFSGNIYYEKDVHTFLKPIWNNGNGDDAIIYYTGEAGKVNGIINAFFLKKNNTKIEVRWNEETQNKWTQLFIMTVTPAEPVENDTINFFDPDKILKGEKDFFDRI